MSIATAIGKEAHKRGWGRPDGGLWVKACKDDGSLPGKGETYVPNVARVWAQGIAKPADVKALVVELYGPTATVTVEQTPAGGKGDTRHAAGKAVLIRTPLVTGKGGQVDVKGWA